MQQDISEKELLRRAKISNTMKGRVPNNKGKRRSDIAKEKFRITAKKIGMGSWNIGRKRPEHEREKISSTMKGRTPSNLELLHSLPRTKEWKQNIARGNMGKTLSEATRRKISDAKRNPLTPLHVSIRRCYKYADWRKAIFHRDNFTCVLCKKRGGELNVDHFPNRFVDIISTSGVTTIEEALSLGALWDINAGRTLCLECHTKTDTFGNKFKKNQVIKVTA